MSLAWNRDPFVSNTAQSRGLDGECRKGSFMWEDHWRPEQHKQQMICRNRFYRNQGRVTDSFFTLHVGWINRGEWEHCACTTTCLVWWLLCCPQKWNCKTSALLSVVEATDWLLTVIVQAQEAPSLAYHPTCKRTFLQDLRRPLGCFRVWQICVRFPTNRFVSMNMHWGWPETEIRKMHISSPHISWAEPDISKNSG